jgi:hypothetical protein
MALQVDDEGNLLVNVAVGGGGGTTIAKIEDSNGNPLDSNGAGALQVDVVGGTIVATNPSVGLTGATAPTSATEMGIIVGGDLEGISASNPVPVTGTVAISGTVPVSGTVAVSNFPATQPVSGTVTVTQATGANLHVDVDNFPATQPVSGTVAVSNFPATQPVSGTVVAEIEGHAGATLDSAAGTPNAQAITIQGNASGVAVPVSGTVAVSSVSGTVTVVQPTGANLHVDVDNFPATQPVSGTVAVSNFPATQPVSGTVVAEIEGHAGAILDGTAGSPSTGVVTVQGVAGGTPQPISGTVTATIATPTNWGTAPATSVPVPAVNAEIFVGQNAVSATTPVPVSATAAANASGNPIFVETVSGSTTAVTGNVTVVQPTGTNLHTVIDSGTITAVTAITNALPAGANTIGKVDILGNAGAILDAVTTAATAPANGLAVLDVYTATPPVLTNGQSLALQADTTGGQYVNQEGRKATYAAQINLQAGITGNNFVLVGSASKTIRITRVIFSGFATAAGAAVVAFQIFSSAFTGGTSTTAGATIGPYDSNSAAATATVKAYTVSPTGGGASQTYPIIFDYQFVASAIGVTQIYDFGNRAAGCPVIRGVAQGFSMYISAAPTGCNYTCFYEWTEE